jgi:hypothetical protein
LDDARRALHRQARFPTASRDGHLSVANCQSCRKHA